MKHQIMLLVMCMLGLSTMALGQQAKLEGQVFDDRDKPVSGVRIIVPGAQSTVTDGKGHFNIGFPDTAQPGQAIRLEVNRPGWLVLDPLSGKYVTQKRGLNFEILKVVIVPKGSLLALSPKRISEVIAKWVVERARLRIQVDHLSSQLNQSDEYTFLKEYAEQYGFSLDQFLNAAKQWAQSKDSDDKEEQARKEYFLKNYVLAAQLAGESAMVAVNELKENKKQRLEKSRIVIRRFALKGNALSDNNDFKGALVAYNEVEKLFSSKDLIKEDVPEEWADIKILLGDVKQELGIRVEGQESQLHLSEAVNDYQQALSVFTRQSYPQEWAVIQNNLGIVLMDQGTRTAGAEAVQLLEQAAKAQREASKVRTREQRPQEWAQTQNNLGNALSTQSDYLEGAGKVQRLAEAGEAFREVLKFYNREQNSKGVAMVQANLGNVLYRQGEGLEGAESVQLLAQAVKAYEEAVKFYARDKQMLQTWAEMQNNLGNVLRVQSERMKGVEGISLLAQAAEAYREILNDKIRQQMPQIWAETQNNHGSILRRQGERLEGAKGLPLLIQAVQAYREALKVFTREYLPQNWARTQNNLGAVLSIQGERLKGDEGAKLHTQAIEACHEALTVFTREHMPQQWATVQNNLGDIYRRLQNWSNAAEAYANALIIYPNDEEVCRPLSSLYQNKLFKFEEAFVLDEQWIARHPDDFPAQALFAEKHFTTGRFAESIQRINLLLNKAEISVSTKIPLRAIEIATVVSLRQNDLVSEKLEILIREISTQPAEFKSAWEFDGSKYFIEHNEKLTPYRAWLAQLFDAFNGKDRDSILTALRQAKANFKK
jgi:tetratricopeptide (TPR) repeat protein